MKFTANLILVILAIPLFLIGLLSATIRFQILSPGFWQNAFDKNNVYSVLSADLKKSVVAETVGGGGRAGDVKFLTDIITPENIQETITKNLANILGYANGIFPELTFYIPISKIPKGLLPQNIVSLSDSVSVANLMHDLNITFVTPAQVRYLSLTGRFTTYLLSVDIGLLAIILFLLFLLVGSGKRFVVPGITILILGLLTFGLYQVGVQAAYGMSGALTDQSTIAEVLTGILGPPLLKEISQTWLITGTVLSAIGIGLFFVRKPV